jgi:hypothetical protein
VAHQRGTGGVEIRGGLEAGVEVGLGMGPLQDVGEHGPEILEVHGTVGHQEELGQRELPFAQDAEGGRQRLGPPSLGQMVSTGRRLASRL